MNANSYNFVFWFLSTVMRTKRIDMLFSFVDYNSHVHSILWELILFLTWTRSL